MKIIFLGNSKLSSLILTFLIHFHYQIFLIYTKAIAKNYVYEVGISKIINTIDAIKFSFIRKEMIFIVISYSFIIDTNYTKKVFSKKLFNLHPSYLPRWKGASPITYFVMKSDILISLSIVDMRQILDLGNLTVNAPIAIGAFSNCINLVIFTSLSYFFIIQIIILTYINKYAFFSIQKKNYSCYSSKIGVIDFIFNSNFTDAENAIFSYCNNNLLLHFYKYRRINFRLSQLKTYLVHRVPGSVVSNNSYISLLSGISHFKIY